MSWFSNRSHFWLILSPVSLHYSSNANKLNKVLRCCYQRFVPGVLWFTSWDLLWHELDGSNIFSPSKLSWAQVPLRIHKLCLQSCLQAFWRLTALPLIYIRLRIALCLHSSEITFPPAFPWHPYVGALYVLNQYQNENTLAVWQREIQRYMSSFLFTTCPSLARTQIIHRSHLPAGRDSYILQSL